jgi:hypothetical protein
MDLLITYSAIGDLHTLQITRAHAKSSQVLSSQNQTHYSSCPGYNFSARTTQKTRFFYCYVRDRCSGNLFTELLPRNGRGADHTENTPFPTTLLFRAYTLPWEREYREVAQKRSLFTRSLLSNGSTRHNIKRKTLKFM